MSTLRTQQASREAPPPAVAAPSALVDNYCLAGHNGRAKAAGLELDTISSRTLEENPEVWGKVVQKLRARQMPPVGVRRPDEATYEAALASLEASLDSLAAANPMVVAALAGKGAKIDI